MMNVTPEKLKEEQKKGTAMSVVDLQSPEDYEHGHIPGAVNIPLEQFEQNYANLLKDKNLAIVVYGEYDELGKGKKAAGILEGAGYTRIGRIAGGLMAWKNAGYPTEGGRES